MRLVLILAGASLLGRAQTLDVKLGLWETTSSTEMSGMPPIDTSKMTPDQRARVEAMMKGRGGGAPTINTSKQCMTKERLEKQVFDGADNRDASCKRTVVSSSSSVMQMKLVCTGDRKMTGDIKFEALSRENVKGTFKIVAGDPAHPMNINSTITAKWLGESCGDVK